MATRKNFTDKDSKSVDVVGEITEEKSASKTEKDTPTERFTARFSKKEWAYLTEYHWQKRTTITDIIRRLVQEDMEKNPDIVATIDELNEKIRPGQDLM